MDLHLRQPDPRLLANYSKHPEEFEYRRQSSASHFEGVAPSPPKVAPGWPAFHQARHLVLRLAAAAQSPDCLSPIATAKYRIAEKVDWIAVWYLRPLRQRTSRLMQDFG
jgi:hypothetical protein